MDQRGPGYSADYTTTLDGTAVHGADRAGRHGTAQDYPAAAGALSRRCFRVAARLQQRDKHEAQ